MDVFGTIVSTIELVGKLVGYLQAVKGAKDDRQKLLLEVSALGTLLDVLRGRLRPSADDNSDSISDMLVKAGIEHPLRMCLEALGPIVRKLESPIPDANVGTSHPTKISEKIRDLKWPFQKTDIKEALNSIERLKTLILLAFQTSLMAFVEKVHEELVTMGLDVKEIKSAVSRLEEGQRAYMKEIEGGFEDLGTKLQHAMSKMENAVADRVTAVQGSIVDNTVEVQKIAAKIDRNQQGQERQDVLKWLSQFAPNFDQKRASAFEKRATGTGEWLLEHSTFKAWQRGEYSVLWCPGNPGVGKSVMTSVIIDHLQGGIADSDDTAMVFIYFDYTVEYKLQRLVEALLFQFVWRGMSVSGMESLQKHMRSNRTALDRLWDIFGAEVKTYAQVFVVVDALDEAAGAWIPLLRHLRKFPNIRILATSRDLGNIATEFREDQRLDIISNEGDLKVYVEGCISDSTGSFEKMVKSDPSLRAEIVTGVVKKAGGMFLLAQLHMDALKTKSNVVNLRRALGELPGNLKSTYDVAMGRISNEDKPLAFHILSWVVRAAQPMTINDLQYALAIELSEDGMTSIDTNCLDDPDRLMSVCVGLVIQRRERDWQSLWDDEDIYVGLVHYTTQDYLCDYVFNPQLPQHVDPAHPAITCLKYFAFDTFNGPFDEDSKWRLRDTPLTVYAIKHWGEHVREHYDVPTIRELAMGLLHNHKRVAVLGSLTFHAHDVSAIHLCAYFGLEDYLIRLMDDGFNVHSKDSDGNTALIVAAGNGHEGIVQLLLKQEGVDVNAKDSNDYTALIKVATHGHEGIVGLLLKHEGVDVNAKNCDDYTALIKAAEHGHEGIVQLLLKQEGIDVNATGVDGDLALTAAAGRGHEGIVQLLLKQEGIDVNAKGSYGDLALTAAVGRGHEGLVQLLLKQEGVDVNAKGSRGDPALTAAAKGGHEGIVQLLLKQEGIDVNATSVDGGLALTAAAGRGHEGIVQLLLKQEDVDVNAKGVLGDLALAAAARGGHEGIVQLLLKQEGVDVNAKGRQGTTPLIQAVMSERQRIAERLLARDGVNINLQDRGGYTPLAQWAIRKKHEAIVRMLLARDDLDISLTDNDRNTYLTLAAQHNRDGCIAKLLLDKGGINVNSRNSKGEVALAVAASHGHDAVIEILLAQDGIDINAMDLEGRTPLDQTSKRDLFDFSDSFDFAYISPLCEQSLALKNTIKLLQAAGARTGVELRAELEGGGAPV